MRNYFMAVASVFKILDTNFWNAFLDPLYSPYPIELTIQITNYSRRVFLKFRVKFPVAYCLLYEGFYLATPIFYFS